VLVEPENLYELQSSAREPACTDCGNGDRSVLRFDMLQKQWQHRLIKNGDNGLRLSDHVSARRIWLGLPEETWTTTLPASKLKEACFTRGCTEFILFQMS
jgi:hypothetical protein